MMDRACNGLAEYFIIEYTTITRTMIKRLIIENFKVFESFRLELNPALNIIVGANESGKSTILEAINLALTKRLNGRMADSELSPFLFNKECVAKFIKKGNDKEDRVLPKILIELYFEPADSLEYLRGTNNSLKEDAVGVKLLIEFNEDYSSEYERLMKDHAQIKTIPTEYYSVHWYSFANNALTQPPLGVSSIDATSIRLQSGTDYYLQSIITGSLDVRQRVALAVAYRGLKEKFAQEDALKAINSTLSARKGAISDKNLEFGIDISSKAGWESNLVPHLDDLPFQLVGKGEQSALKIMLALERKADNSHVILIEEPENHLSYAAMNILMTKIRDKCADKQIVIVTHSAYVLNKLGIENVIFLHNQHTSSLKSLPQDTQRYFRKLSGYDTLRLILAKRAILVEGPSDELIIQRAYLDKHGKLPIEDGVDIITVRGLSFARFLDISVQLKKKTVVVTDNDGDYENNVKKKYAMFTIYDFIDVFAGEEVDGKTLEPQLIKSNGLEVLNKVFGRDYASEEELRVYMESNKTDCALSILDAKTTIRYPKYISDAVA